MGTYAKAVAFVVTEDFDGSAVITYAKSHAEARRNGAGELDREFGSVRCRRDARYDNGYTTAQLIEDGWHFQCHGPDCMKRVDEDEPLRVIVGSAAYCGPKCRDAGESERRSKAEKLDAATAEALRIRPDVKVERGFVNVAGEAILTFKFPNGDQVTSTVEWLAQQAGARS